MRHLVCVVAAMACVSSSAAGQDGTRFPVESSHRQPTTDADLARLPFPEKLEIVVLRGQSGFGIDTVTDTGIAHLSRYPRLRALHAGGLGLTDRVLESIGKLAGLEELHLDSNRLTGAGLRHLTGLKKLRKLNLSFNSLRPDAFATLAQLTGLTHLLVLSGPKVDDQVLEQCAKLANLEELRLSEDTTAVTDRGIEHLAGLKNLKNLALRGAIGVTDTGLAQLAELPHLEELSLRNLGSVTPRGLDVLAKLPELRRLDIESLSMDDRSVRALAPLKKLERLLLWNVAIQPLTLDTVGELQSLRTFRTNQAVSSSAIQALAKLKDLESITDELTEVTDEDVRHLARLPKLQVLVLGSEHVTADSLPTLARMTALRELFVTEHVRIRPEQWQALGQSSLTQCRISRFRPPYTVYYQPTAPDRSSK